MNVVVVRVRQDIDRHLGTPRSSLVLCSDRLGYSSSKRLQVDLSAAGAQYSQLLAEIRLHHAQKLLLARRPPRLIAKVLGLTWPRFFEAFKRWTGQTPGEWLAEERGL